MYTAVETNLDPLILGRARVMLAPTDGRITLSGVGTGIFLVNVGRH